MCAGIQLVPPKKYWCFHTLHTKFSQPQYRTLYRYSLYFMPSRLNDRSMAYCFWSCVLQLWYPFKRHMLNDLVTLTLALILKHSGSILRNALVPCETYYQESVTTRQTDGWTIRRRTKWSLCAAMLRRRHRKNAFYAPGLKGPPGASSNRIVRPSVCLSVCP